MAEEMAKTSSGVQELITRIRDQGVQAGKEEADDLVAKARQKAARIVEQAEEETTALRDKNHAEIESDKAAALEALKLAARDTELELRAAVVGSFERKVKSLVSDVTLKGDFLEALVLVLAGRSADDYIKDKDIKLLVSDLVFAEGDDEELEERADRSTLAIASDMLREGVELVPASDVEGGVRVQIVEDNLQIDLTSEAISRLLLRNLLPRFRKLLSGAG